MCNIEVDKHESSRVVKWQDLLKLRRSGTVFDGYIAECVDSIFEKTIEKLAGGERKLNETAHQVTETRAEKEKLSMNLNSTLAELEEVTED